MPRLLAVLAIAASFVCSIPARAQPCEPHWTTDFPQGGTDGPISCMAVYDDGTGPALYFAGEFQHVGAQPAAGIARWDGTSLTPVPAAPPWGVQSMAVFDDGAGPTLAAASGAVWALRAGAWNQLGGSEYAHVRCIGTHDDGSGAHLYAAGWFGSAQPSVDPERLARWNGSQWELLPGGFTGGGFFYPPDIRCIQSIDLGEGPVLYLGGSFVSIDGDPVAGLARWDGSAWHAVAGGLTRWDAPPDVATIIRVDSLSGPSLYVAGQFSSAGGIVAQNIARFDGAAWLSVGVLDSYYISALAPLPTPAGPRLFATGSFNFPSIETAFLTAMWDGQSWVPAGGGDDPYGAFGEWIAALTTFDAGSGPMLYAGGSFSQLGSVAANNFAAWDGSEWAPLLHPHGLSSYPTALVSFDDGRGPAVYAGGYNQFCGGTFTGGLGRWDGHEWTAVDSRFQGYVVALAAFNDGRGEALYVGAWFAGQIPELPRAWGVGRWDGTRWENVDLPPYTHLVHSLATGDDGNGAGLFIGGDFPGAIVKWDGTQLQFLGAGLDGPWPRVDAIATYRENGVSVLYVGGAFNEAGGIPVQNLAKWDGHAWSAVGFEPPSDVLAMTVQRGPDRDTLYVGGSFSGWFPERIEQVAAWDGHQWHGVGHDRLGSGVCALSVFDDGSGPALYAAGDLESWWTYPAPLFNIAKWNGQTWNSLSGGVGSLDMDDGVSAMTEFTDASGPSLIIAGNFQSAGGLPAGRIARWLACPAGGCYANCDNSTTPPILNIADFACFLNRFAAADPAANCDHSATPPTLNILDFMCFLNRFAAGCP